MLKGWFDVAAGDVHDPERWEVPGFHSISEFVPVKELRVLRFS